MFCTYDIRVQSTLNCIIAGLRYHVTDYGENAVLGIPRYVSRDGVVWRAVHGRPTGAMLCISFRLSNPFLLHNLVVSSFIHNVVRMYEILVNTEHNALHQWTRIVSCEEEYSTFSQRHIHSQLSRMTLIKTVCL